MSEKLYYNDSFMREFDGVVTSCSRDKKGWAVVLAATAFYPEGGGQPHDTGFFTVGEGEDIKTIAVTDVREKGEEIIHYCDAEIPAGTAVHGVIDWDRRFDMMQQHTGEHIFSGIVHSLFGLNNVGFHLNERETVVDFDGPLTAREIQQVEDACNREVWRNRPVTATFPENVADLEYRSKKRLEGEIRIVKAGEADMCACCGTHTATTAQAGPIVAVSHQSYKGGVRITMHCGARAVKYLKNRSDDCFEISHALSSPLENITGAVAARLNEINSLKTQLAERERELVTLWAKDVPAEEGIRATVKNNLSSASLQRLAAALADRADIAVVISPRRESSPKICIVSQTADTNKLGRFISRQLGGKGGGKPGVYQGFVEKECDRQTLTALVKDFLRQG